MLEIKATPKFMRDANKAMTAEALQALIDYLTLNPEQGAVIKGTGGIRKIRWRTGKDNKGKSGGIRVLYYYDGHHIVLLITLYRKSEKANIDSGEKAKLHKLVMELLGG